jgi:hypothetical protein
MGVAGRLPMDWLEGCGQLKPVAGKDVLGFYRVVSSSLKQEEPVYSGSQCL